MYRVESNPLDSSRGLLQMKLGLDKLRVPLGALMLAMLLLGCSRTLAKPPETADKHAQRDSTQSENPPAREYPEHIAPPPAYGNKVVMAELESGAAF